MTGKERAKLRALANDLEPILFVGKEGVTENIIKQADDALKARELIKGSVQKTCDYSVREVADILSKELGAQGIQVIGRKFTIYRENED